MRLPLLPSPAPAAACAGWKWVLAVALFLPLTVLAQPAAQPAPAPRSTPVPSAQTRHDLRRSHRRSIHAKAASVPAAIPAPPPPVPPALQLPQPAIIQLTRGSLRIEANNSSLVQILAQVAHRTGLDIEGVGHDQRIYGQYGPGSVGSTLAQLLDGSGYNYVLVGGDRDHPPTRLLLTAKGSAPAVVPASTLTAPASSGQDTPAANTPENPSEPVHPKTPQEIFDELRHLPPPPS